MLAEAASASASRALRDRDMFLAMLGHDLRSPLTAMALAGQMLALPDVGTEPTRLVGARILRGAASMTAMVTDLLQCARTQLGGTIPISPRPADMREICQAALEDAGAAHPDCTFELATSGELTDEFDSARLQQVLGNLLNNAVQYRTKGRPVTLSAEGGPDAIFVRVRNHGPIIPAASLQSIFDPLVQLPLDGTPHTRPPGSLGLGLFIARQITQAHGGTIQAQSDAASGTVFTLRLPRQHVAASSALVH
jgi:signal transduction histidine kinase